jgi:hypothetical protein
MTKDFPQFPHTYPVDDGWDLEYLMTLTESHLRNMFSRRHGKRKVCLIFPHTSHLGVAHGISAAYLLTDAELVELGVGVLPAVLEQAVVVECCMKRT